MIRPDYSSNTVTVPIINLENLEMPTISGHFKNLVKPTLFTNEKNWDKFISLSGRGICLVRILDYTLNLPFRAMQTISLIAIAVLNIFRFLVTLPLNFSQSATLLKENFYVFISQTVGLIIMPLSVMVDGAKLMLGVVLHPAIGINTVSFRYAGQEAYTGNGGESTLDADGNVLNGKDVILGGPNGRSVVDKNGVVLIAR